MTFWESQVYTEDGHLVLKMEPRPDSGDGSGDQTGGGGNDNGGGADNGDGADNGSGCGCEDLQAIQNTMALLTPSDIVDLLWEQFDAL